MSPTPIVATERISRGAREGRPFGGKPMTDPAATYVGLDVAKDHLDDAAILASLLQRGVEAAANAEQLPPSRERYRVLVIEACDQCGRTCGTHAELTDTIAMDYVNQLMAMLTVPDPQRTLWSDDADSQKHKEIAEKAEFAIGTVYKFFQNKEDLYKALVLEQCDRFEAAVTRALEESEDEVLDEVVDEDELSLGVRLPRLSVR